MNRKFKLLSILLAISILLGMVPAFVTASEDAPIEYTLEGIGTDALQYWSFYYTTAPAGTEDPTDGMRPLSKPGRAVVGNDCWPFTSFKNSLITYDDPNWEEGEVQDLVFFYNAQYLFLLPNNTTAHTSPIVAFTAPENGRYTITFDGSVSWSAGDTFVNAYVNGEIVENSYYLFDTTQGTVGQGKKAYSLEVNLRAGEQLCLVFERPSSSIRCNIENL